MRESKFQSDLIEELRWLFPDCIILKNDSGYLQGVPDLVILYNDRWAMLECKASIYAKNQPNQDYYINLLNGMSFAAFIYPENKEDIIDELQQAFRTGR